MQSPGREVVVERNKDTHPVDDPSGWKGGSHQSNRSSYHDTGGDAPVDEAWKMTDAREHDGQRPKRHLPSSLRAKALIVPGPCDIWWKFFC